MEVAIATLADRIAKRAKPDELPIQQRTKFEQVINLKTAKTLLHARVGK